MTRLLKWTPKPVEARYGVDDYVGMLNQFSYGGVTYGAGITQTLTGTREAIGTDYIGLVAGAYMSNGIVFSCMLVRQLVFSAIRFQYQRIMEGRPSDLWGDQTLSLLETPWPGGTTQDFLGRVIQDADLAGNSYWAKDTPLARMGGDGTELVRLRPDRVTIILEPRKLGGGTVGYRKVGYTYSEQGADTRDMAVFLPSDIVHFAPLPDPAASYRGMSWLTPVIREIQGDQLMGTHLIKFHENGATPNMVVRHGPDVDAEGALAFKRMFDVAMSGTDNAYKTLHVGGGADITLVGKDMRQMDFTNVRGHGETRIAAAAGVPPVIAGFSEGLQAATYSNYAQARRRFADGTMHPLWQNIAGSLSTLFKPSGASRMWYDSRDIPFLREDEMDASQIKQTEASTMQTLINSGFEPASVAKFMDSGDYRALTHTGLVSVQLQPPGTMADPGTDGKADAPTTKKPPAGKGKADA